MSMKENLTRFLEKQKEIGVPGCSAAVIHNDKEVYRYCTGYADLENGRKIDDNTLFRLCSMTKIITVTAALQLYEKGMYHLNDPLYEYIPEYKDMKVCYSDVSGNEAVRPAKNHILIKDLFSMTAGLTYGGNSNEAERATSRIIADLEKNRGASKFETLEFVRALAAAPLCFDPGEGWFYSMCHDVLGGFIEVLTGKKFGEYLRENIFDPLGMKDIFFRCPEQKKQDLACGYNVDGPEPISITDMDASYDKDAVYEAGGSGLLSTLGDYLIFANTLCRGGTSTDDVRILGRKTIDLMRTNHLNEEQKKSLNWPQIKGYGYGLGVRTMIDCPAGGCNGSLGEFGWDGMAGTWVLMDPAERLTAVYMQQMLPNKQEYTEPRLRSIIYGSLD